MYGWRARLGRINPSPETVGDEEWRRLCPDGVIVVSTRMYIERVDAEGLTSMVTNVERAAKELASARVNVILMAGTAGAFNGGPGFDRELASRMEKAGGVRATTTMSAVLEALAHLGLGKIAIATSYVKSVDDMLADTLRKEGVDVAAIEGMGLLKSIDMGDVEPERTYDFAREAFKRAGDVDGYLISCGNLRTLEVIRQLEKDFGRPVITSNQAGMWKVLRMCELDPPRASEGGRLFDPR
jgi:maleate cis-trans isomerase